MRPDMRLSGWLAALWLAPAGATLDAPCATHPGVAATCVACHGNGSGDEPPTLHGQPQAPLLARLRGYAAPAEEGTAPTVMHRMLLGVEDRTLVQLAEHFACSPPRP